MSEDPRLSREVEEYASWRLALSWEPEYFTNTALGQKELADLLG